MTDDTERDEARARMRNRVGEPLKKAATDPRRDQLDMIVEAAAMMLAADMADAILRAQLGHQPEPIEQWDTAVSGRGRLGRERAWAMGDIAAAYGAGVTWRDNYAHNKPRRVHIIAHRSDIEALKILLPAADFRIENAASAAARRHADRLRDQPELNDIDRHRELVSYSRASLTVYATSVAEEIDTARRIIIANIGTSNEDTQVLTEREERVRAEFLNCFRDIKE